MWQWIKKIHAEYLLVVLYCFILRGIFHIAPLSFEDHFAFTQFLLVIVFFLPRRFTSQTESIDQKTALTYALGFLFTHLIVQVSFLLIFQEVCKWSYSLLWYFILEIPSLFLLTQLCLFSRFYGKNKWAPLLHTSLFVLFFLGWNTYNFLQTPTLFLHHPTIGYFPGPIFDEWIPIDKTLIFSRAWAVLIGIAFMLSCKYKKILWGLPLLLLPIFFQTTLGLRTTHNSLQEVLKNKFETTYAQIYTDQTQLNPISLYSVDYWIELVSIHLDIPTPKEKIKIYLYSNDLLKKKLTGSQYTLIGNPRQKSLHLLSLSSWNTLLTHELTHVIASPLNTNVFHLNMNMAISEGLAMSIQKTSMGLSIHQWAKAIDKYSSIRSLDTFFSLTSFYSLPSQHAYTLSGSFVSFLIKDYGIEAFKNLYGGSSLEESYGAPKHMLFNQWVKFLETVELEDSDYIKMKEVLERKSVFEKKCVHEIAYGLHQYKKCFDANCKDRWIQYAYTCNPEDPNLTKLYTLSLLKNGQEKKAKEVSMPFLRVKEIYDVVTGKIPDQKFPLIQQDHPELIKTFYMQEEPDLENIRKIDNENPEKSLFLLSLLRNGFFQKDNEYQKTVLEMIDTEKISQEDFLYEFYISAAQIYENVGELNKALNYLIGAMELKNSTLLQDQLERLSWIETVLMQEKNPAQTIQHQP